MRAMPPLSLFRPLPTDARPAAGTSASPDAAALPTMFALSVLASAALCLVAIVCAGETPFRSSVVALAICTIATTHYMGILRLRLRSQVGDPSTEFSIDLLRHSDWLITLPLLQFELFELARRAGRSTDVGYLNPVLAIVLQVPVILLGAVGRFYADQRVDPSSAAGLAGLVGYVGSMVIWLLTTVNFYAVIYSEDGPWSSDESTLSTWCTVLISAQWGYPLVALVQVLSKLNIKGFFFDGRNLTILKDYAYAMLDITSKATLVLVLTFTDL
jgi:hypothetical protein